MDPIYTLTVNKWQTGCGCFDIFSHQLEQYYELGESFSWAKEYLLANMKNLMKYAKGVMKNPKDLEARANILWTSAWSLNGLASVGSEHRGDWKVHGLAHAISGKWDASHGASLALITPVYIEYMCKKNKKFKELSLEIAKEVFKVKTINDYLKKIKEYIKLCGLPQKYTDFNNIKKITKQDLEWLSKAFDKYMDNQHHKLGIDIYNKIKK